ncbi:CHAT domain-containing protein [Rugamonas sp. DEMB1]|uniref:CHAT domain-containing protein n=1 Tax=Rugamonas sp. DEMB1 TaxID=3039386 RepID=UPI002449D206|nr:CHAT domain-containing protein [Rugamonas sp. DEMB1]WGG48508.1 CHAT domain-containing protein [Rugamonas sp. DEMB1]
MLPIPGDTFALARALSNDPVQLVHFFCHGYAQDNVPRLEFASINDHDIGAARGSIDLSLERLGPALAAAGTVWLTVLSSCSSAQEVPRLFSMARELANTVSPVAIGMAEPMQPGDASLFADGFYRKAFEIIGNALAGMALGQTTRIDFGAAVAQARANLHSKAQAPGEEDNAFGRWCLPVMYQRDAPLKVGLASVDMRKRIALVGQTLRNLPASTPVALREQILAMLAQEPVVPPALRPDLDGGFR